MNHTTIIAATLFTLATPLFGQRPEPRWIATWSSAQQTPETQNALRADDLNDATLRQIVHVSLGGNTIRVHLSNAFGWQPLHISSAHLAKPVPHSGSILPGTEKALTFSNAQDVTIPAGAEIVSDPVEFKLDGLSDIAVTLHVDHAPQSQTSHPGSHATSYLAHGDLVSSTDLASARKVEHWFFLSEVDVAASKRASTLVAFGDSITDGHGSTTDGNDRWPDDLAALLQQSKHTGNIAVVNKGIGGNRMLQDGLGPNALARFDRDVLAPSGVTAVLLLEGVNDLGGLARKTTAVTLEERALLLQAIKASYEQFVLRAHAHGLRVLGATVLPYIGSDYYHPSPADEAERQKLNEWIRQPGHFDAVVDFDRVTADPANPGRLQASYDSGDHLHPSPAGYRAMAAAVASAMK